MSDEKKGAVLTGEELDELERETHAYLRVLTAERNGSRAEEPLLSAGGRLVLAFDRFGGEHAVILSLIAEARKARLAADLLEEHGPYLLNALKAAGDARLALGHTTAAQAYTITEAALSSTIAAFRKGAE